MSTSERENRIKRQKNMAIKKIFIVIVYLITIIVVLKYAYNFAKDNSDAKVNMVVNDENITTSLNKDIFLEKGIVYLAKEDIATFFDPYIYYDEKYNQIITGSEDKIASIVIGDKKMTNNGSTVSIPATIIKKDETYYIPFSALSDIYNVKTTYIEKTNTIVVDSLYKKMIMADSSKNNNVKYSPSNTSETVEKIQKGENIVVFDVKERGWVKIRTDSGKLGYIKENTIVNETTVRDEMIITPKIDENITVKYSSSYQDEDLQGVDVVSPAFFTITESGKVSGSIDNKKKKYIQLAHDKGCKVWPSISNNSKAEATSKVLNDYKLREKLINNIVSAIVKYDLDGINISFENMEAKDKDLFSRFIIELKPHLNEIGAVLSVSIKIQEGQSEELIYDRQLINNVANYVS